MEGIEEPLSLASARGRWVVVATVLGSALAGLDSTVVNVALPRIGRDLGGGVAALQWVVSGYLLTLAALILLAGALSDRFGRRRVFLVGVVWFTAASVACGLAPSTSVLTAARALQGVGGALLTPGSLAILEASFRRDERAAAIGAWTGLGGVAYAIGPFVGGWLVQAWSWRLVFFINVPIAIAVTLIALRHVPETRDPAAPRRLDFVGGALAVIALGSITYALIELPAHGARAHDVVAAAAVGVVLALAFVLVERRRAAPMLELALFRSRPFAAANAETFVVYAALGGAMFLLPIELQQSLGYSPLAAGAALLPTTAVMLLLSTTMGRLAQRIGPRVPLTVGPIVVAGGLLLLARATAGGSYVAMLLPPLVVFGLGLAITVAPITATVLAAAPTDKAGLASAINNCVARTGSLIAVATLPAAGYRRGMGVAALACVAGGLIALAALANARRDRCASRQAG